jgi:hypothetical protein
VHRGFIVTGDNHSVAQDLQRIVRRKSIHGDKSGTQQHKTEQYAEVPFGFAHLHHLFFSQEPSESRARNALERWLEPGQKSPARPTNLDQAHKSFKKRLHIFVSKDDFILSFETFLVNKFYAIKES